MYRAVRDLFSMADEFPRLWDFTPSFKKHAGAVMNSQGHSFVGRAARDTAVMRIKKPHNRRMTTSIRPITLHSPHLILCRWRRTTSIGLNRLGCCGEATGWARCLSFRPRQFPWTLSLMEQSKTWEQVMDGDLSDKVGPPASPHVLRWRGRW
jgi:hypothetical protein